MTTAERFGVLLSVLGDSDPFRKVWDDSDEKTRAMLARVGGVPAFISGDKWRDVPASYRGQIKRRAATLRDWLNKVLP